MKSLQRLSYNLYHKLLRHLADQQKVGTIITDAKLVVTDIDELCCKILDIEPADILGMSLKKMIGTEEAQLILRSVARFPEGVQVTSNHLGQDSQPLLLTLFADVKNDSIQSVVILVQHELLPASVEKQVAEKIAVEKTISAVSRLLFEKGDIEGCLESMGKFAQSNRSYIFYLRNDQRIMDNVYEWCDGQTEPQKEVLQNIPTDLFPWWMEQLRNRRTIEISDVDEMPLEAEREQEILRQQSILSLLVVPMFNQDELLGFVGFDDTVHKRHWSASEKKFLGIMAEMIASFENRKRAERKLYDLTQTYRTLAEAAKDLIFIIDREDTVRYVNKYAAHLLGKTPEQIIGCNRGVLFPKDKQQKEFLEKVFRTGEDVYEERRLEFPGVDIWLGTSLVPLKDEQGNVYSILGVARDITDKIHAQQELLRRTEEYKLLVENSSDLIIKVDKNNIIQYVSPAYCAAFGKTGEELVGNTFWPLVHKDDKIKTQKAMEQLFSPPYKCYVEQRAKTVDGWRWFGWADSAVLDSNGEVASIIGVGRDVTERVLAEQALAENERKYRGLFNKLNDAIFIMEKARFIECNKAARELFQLSQKEIVNKHPWDISPEYQPSGELSKTLAEKVISAALRGQDQSFEWVHQKSNGDTFYADVNLHRIKLGGKWRLLAQVRDVSQRIEHQQALRESEEQYRNLYNCATEVIFIIDNYRIVDCNPQTAKLVGMELEQILGKHPWEILPQPEGELSKAIEEIREVFDEVLNGAEKQYLWTHKRDDGNIIHLEIKLIRTVTNGQTRILGMGHDITARVNTENLIRESEQRFRDTVERSLDAFFALNIDGCITLVNSRFEEMFGKTWREVKKRPFPEIISPENREEFTRLIKKALDGEAISWKEFLESRKDATELWIAVSVRRVIRDGVVVGVEGFIKDITQLKKAEQALVKSEAGYRSLFEALPNEVFSLDREGVIINANPKFMERWGKKVVGKHIGNAFKSPKLCRYYDEAFIEVVKTHKPKTFNYSFRMNKQKYQTRCILNPILLGANELIGVVGINIDMTELLDALDRSKSYASRLVEIQEQERKRISREIHDSLGGYLSGLQLEIANIKNAVERADKQMIDRILASSKSTINEAIRSAHELCYDLRPHILDDFGLVSAVKQYISDYTHRAQIRVEFKHEGDDLSLPGTHSLALFRFVQEALTNVANHAGASLVKMKLEINPEFVTFSIMDNGKGFEPDFQRNRYIRRLGLVNMAERMELLNGELDIKSDSEMGTEIVARLPLNRGENNGH